MRTPPLPVSWHDPDPSLAGLFCERLGHTVWLAFRLLLAAFSPSLLRFVSLHLLAVVGSLSVDQYRLCPLEKWPCTEQDFQQMPLDFVRGSQAIMWNNGTLYPIPHAAKYPL